MTEGKVPQWAAQVLLDVFICSLEQRRESAGDINMKACMKKFNI